MKNKLKVIAGAMLFTAINVVSVELTNIAINKIRARIYSRKKKKVGFIQE